jgi:hypothetical protein
MESRSVRNSVIGRGYLPNRCSPDDHPSLTSPNPSTNTNTNTNTSPDRNGSIFSTKNGAYHSIWVEKIDPFRGLLGG